MKRFKFVLLLCTFLMAFTVLPNTIFAFSSEAQISKTDLFDNISQILVPKQKQRQLDSVILGGIPIGISLNNDCVEVLGFSEIITNDGVSSPAAESGLRIGDKIIKIDGNKVSKVIDVSNAVQKNKMLEISFLRNGSQETVSIMPKQDILTGKYKLGMWVKDVSSGIGTLTFVKDGQYFGSLGHPITSKTGEIIEINGGKVHECTILGVEKGEKGDAGELKGAFNNSKEVGNIIKNNKFGVYGTFCQYPTSLDLKNIIQVASISEVKPGKAQIYSTIDGDKPQLYDIEIVKATNQTEKDDKGLVIKVMDKTLLSKTGGIVQGMSGSPIIQNNKLVGAVTHVFINDPTRGFGMFAEWMLQE